MKLVNKQDLRNALLAILGVLFTVASVSLFAYLWIELGDRGMRADALHSSGYTTLQDVVAVILAVVLIVASVVCFRLIKDLGSLYRTGLKITICIVVIAAILFCIVQSFTYR
jgi:heme/copper-type cytochrome/quinol oxidase subunit 3